MLGSKENTTQTQVLYSDNVALVHPKSFMSKYDHLVLHFLANMTIYIHCQNLKELYGLGGRAFLVLNLAPVGCYPAFLVELSHGSSDLDEFGCAMSYNNAVVDYNYMLKETLAQTRKALSNAFLIYVDTYSVLLQLFRHPKSHGTTFA